MALWTLNLWFRVLGWEVEEVDVDDDVDGSLDLGQAGEDVGLEVLVLGTLGRGTSWSSKSSSSMSTSWMSSPAGTYLLVILDLLTCS